MPRNYSQRHRYHNPSFRSYTSLKQSKAIQKQNSRYDNKKTAESLEQRDNEIQLNQSIEIKSVKYAFGIICILCNSNLVLPAIATANSMQANKISAGAYHNEHNKVQEPCAVITHPFHFTATSCAGLDHAIIQDCLGAASNKMFQLMHPYLPTVKQECIVRKGLDTEQWNSNATAGDHRSTGNKGNNIITCEIRIREGYQNHPKVIQHELVHAFHNQYSPHGRGGWSRLFEELPQYIAVSDNKGLIPDSYCKATQRYHTNNMGSFDDILRSNESVYTLGPAYVGYFEATHPGLIRDHIICVSNSRAEYNNCDVNRDKCRDMNQPFKEGCYNARSECYSNLTQPCTDARSSCHQHKENERTLCTAARDQCSSYKPQRSLCEVAYHSCDRKIISSYSECYSDYIQCANSSKIVNDTTCNDKYSNCMKQNEPAQLHCDEDKKKCLTLVDEKCLTPLRERYNTQEFNEYLTNGCQVDINFHNIVKGPKYSLGNEQVIPPIPSPTNYAKITTNPVIPQLITTTTSPTKLTTSKVSAPNSITITCDNNVENCRVSYYPPLDNNEKIIVTLQKQGQSKQKIHCDPGVTVWVNDQHDNVIANGISPEQVKYLENIRCTQSKGHQQTSPTVPSTRSPDTEAVADIPNIFNNPTYRTLPNSLASDTTFAAQNNATVLTPSADPGDISRNMLFSIFSILGVGVGALLAGCGYYMYRKREHNKKTANRDPENNITHIEDPSKKTKDKKLYHSPYSKPIKQKPDSSVQKKQKVINKKQVEESATLVLENVEDEGITIEHNDDKLDRKAMLPHLIAVYPALNNNLQEERENYGEGAGMFVDETNDHAELPVPMVGEGSDLL